MSILRYLKGPSNELPQPAEVSGVPASTVLAVNRSVESTVMKRRYLRYNRYSYQNSLRSFIAWYSDQVRTQLDRGIKIEEVKVDMRLSAVKPLSAKWVIKAVYEVASRPCKRISESWNFICLP